MRIHKVTTGLLLAVFISSASAIEKAGDLIVDVDASTYEVGSGTWTNAGTYSSFTAVGEPGLMTIGDSPAVIFDGSTAFVGSEAAPESITAFETRSIEAWVFNPSIVGEETVVSWGKRGGPDGSNMAFNYGNHGNFGAVGHWGGGTYDVGWVDNDFTFGAPEAYKWHHLAYVFDESTTRVYADGVLQNEEDTVSLFGDLSTHEDTAIAIAAQWLGGASLDSLGDPALLEPGLRGALGIGRLRVHSGVLEDTQIEANYNEEKEFYTTNPPLPPGISHNAIGEVIFSQSGADPVATPLSKSPIHRYSFNNPASDDATGAELTDSIGGAHGVVISGEFGDLPEFTGTELRLPGGVSADAPYGDLPNGLISGLEATTIESWVTIEGVQTWSRIFDFGSNSPGGDDGELTGTEDDNGGNTEGLDYLFLSAQRGGEANQHRVEFRNEDPAGGGITTVDFDIEKELPETFHFAVVYDPEGNPILDFLLNPTGEFTPALKVYANGELVAEGGTSLELSDLNDVNNWLGRSNWTNDANFEGTFDEFRIYDYALSPDEVLGSSEAGPDELVVSEGIAGDVDGNGKVEFADFLILAENFGQPADPAGCCGDIDGNGEVAFADFLILAENFGKMVGQAGSAVPEPSGMAVLVILGLSLVDWNRRRKR